MSSLVSLRSYQRRRKSAGARLEGAYAQSLSPPGSIPPISPGQPPGTAPHGIKPLPLLREKRVKSARETRREQEASDIFPELQRGGVDPEWGKTKYSEDFGPKKVTPIEVRPISPTRMNNPHPSKEFMIWKHPMRIHEHKKAINPPPDVWRYIYERFYEDYLDKYNTGDAKNEVPVTNLAKIKFPGKKEHSAHPINGISGKKAQLNSRQPSHVGTGEEGEPQRVVIRPPSPQSLLMHHTLKGGSLPVFKEWLKSATSNERDVLLEMLHAAHEDSEEARLGKVVNDVLQAESADRVQEWLKNASVTDRQIVLNVLETLAVTTTEGADMGTHTYPALYPRLQHRHIRGHTFPLSLQGGHPSYSDLHKLGEPRSKHHHHHHHHHRHRSKHSSSSSKHSSASSEGAGSRPSAQMGLVGKKIAKPERVYDENPELWQNRILKKKLGTSKTHAAGVFGQPRKDKGQHFSIHPEWPTA